MPANTSPDSIPYPVSSDAVAPLETVFANMATGLQTALTNTKVFRVADLTALNALTATNGVAAIVAEGGAIFVANGTTYVQTDPARFATTTARDTAYAKASGVYKVMGAQAITADYPDLVWQYYTAYNATTNISGTSVGGTPTAGWFPVTGSNIFTDVTYQQPAWGNATEAVVPWNTEVSDIYDMHSNTTSPERITPKFAGRYRVSYSNNWGGNNTGARLTRFRPNGSASLLTGGRTSDLPPTTGTTGGAGDSGIAVDGIRFNGTTDYCDCTAYQASGGSLAYVGHIILTYVGPPVGP